MPYRDNIVKKINEQININVYPPTFHKKLFEKKIRNCYAYVLDLYVNDPRHEVLIPGCISDEAEYQEIFCNEELVYRFKKDLDFLGFSYRDNSNVLRHGEYRIALYSCPSFYNQPISFHFARQDKDGNWSEKRNWKEEPNKIDYRGRTAPDLNYSFSTVFIIKKKN